MSPWYHGGMTDDVNATTWRFSLRGTRKDKAILQRVVQAHEQMGLKISLNDAVLVLIRRSAIPDADTEEEAWRGIEQHWADCLGGCDHRNVKCPEGWRLRDALHRVAPNPTPRPAPGANPSPAPPPPLPEQPTADVVPLPAWRRYFGVGRKAS